MMKLKLISCVLAASICLMGAALPDGPTVEDASTPASSVAESSSIPDESSSDVSSMPEADASSSTLESAPEDMEKPPIEDSSAPTDADSSEASSEDTASSETASESEAVPEEDLPTEEIPAVQADNCITDELAVLLATNQADSMMGNLGLVRSGDCTEIIATFTVADYNTKNNQDANYAALWADMNVAFHSVADGTVANCVYADGVITILM